MDVKTAIRTGDAAALRQILRENPALANELIEWGHPKICRTHPLHFVCDMLFQRVVSEGADVPLIDALIQAGANLDFQVDGRGDTPLIGAASLGAEDAGIRLVDAGAKPAVRGLFGETALHWAALFGEHRLVAKLLENSDPTILSLKDEKYQSTPLGWARHGREAPGNPADHGHHSEVIELLKAAGADG